jgi:hypothetical protein
MSLETTLEGTLASVDEFKAEAVSSPPATEFCICISPKRVRIN